MSKGFGENDQVFIMESVVSYLASKTHVVNTKKPAREMGRLSIQNN